MMEIIIDDPQLLNNIVFSDEATFELTGNVNRHNFRWSDVNSDWMRGNHTQYPQKVNVWTGILNGRPIGPFFIEDNLNARVYKAMLREQIIPAIQNIADENLDDIYFQQGGASPHYGVNVRQYLDEVFLDRWIRRRSHIEWPTRSPDLNSLDYFF